MNIFIDESGNSGDLIKEHIDSLILQNSLSLFWLV